jgi:hypothetical protein
MYDLRKETQRPRGSKFLARESTVPLATGDVVAVKTHRQLPCSEETSSETGLKYPSCWRKSKEPSFVLEPKPRVAVEHLYRTLDARARSSRHHGSVPAPGFFSAPGTKTLEGKLANFEDRVMYTDILDSEQLIELRLEFEKACAELFLGANADDEKTPPGPCQPHADPRPRTWKRPYLRPCAGHAACAAEVKVASQA